MKTAVYLLFSLGLLGAVDILIFHSVAHGIRSHSHAARELVAHSLRGPTYAILFILIPNFRPQGLCVCAIAALLLFDVAVSICDFALERESRRLLGGLPGGEYVLHMIIAMLFGAFVVAFLNSTVSALHQPTLLRYAPAAPRWLRGLLLAMAGGILVSGLQDARAAFRLKRFGSICQRG